MIGVLRARRLPSRRASSRACRTARRGRTRAGARRVDERRRRRARCRRASGRGRSSRRTPDRRLDAVAWHIRAPVVNCSAVVRGSAMSAGARRRNRTSPLQSKPARASSPPSRYGCRAEGRGGVEHGVEDAPTGPGSRDVDRRDSEMPCAAERRGAWRTGRWQQRRRTRAQGRYAGVSMRPSYRPTATRSPSQYASPDVNPCNSLTPCMLTPRRFLTTIERTSQNDLGVMEQTLLLNATYEPLKVVHWQKAITLWARARSRSSPNTTARSGPSRSVSSCRR